MRECWYRKGERENLAKARVDPATMDYLLREVAARMVDCSRQEKASVEGIPYPDAFANLSLPGGTVDGYLDAAESHGLICWRGGARGDNRSVEFSHSLFQAYFVARHLLRLQSGEREGRVMRLMGDRRWHESLRMLFGLLEDRAETRTLLKTIADQDLFLAFDCGTEACLCV